MKQVLSLLLVLMMAFPCASYDGKDGSTSKGDDNMSNNRAANQAGTTNETNNQAAQPAAPSDAEHNRAKEVRIKLTFNNEEFIVKMVDHPTSRDFLSRLPLTLTFKEFGGFEKLSVLDEGLSTESAPPGDDPEVGDFGYYAPWKDVMIESDPEELTAKLEAMHDDFTVTIQKID
ncbi:hypothetical protein PAESOLCIP111_06406 [Paenibacillus solanacearum]|uniref:Cyclophilin-like domain-containing protein n=1 Tax=Paenibacillus solanacearum TaxID=2048548 RepID=A0A916KAK3_9BACL|nr:cyclophilin-like fold protein [Paenibacillus solanacearum]CAG7651851.1 hypothetical protein PAESOLCIP111_06406 [Paenibacillus solanacearum]